MLHLSIRRRALRWLAAVALLGLGFTAFAQTEPTVQQIYAEAQAGHLVQAQAMLDQVLKAHPNSAKAHFVAAELAVRQNQMRLARTELAKAESLAPGLPFAKPEAVGSLRARLEPSSEAAVSAGPGLGVPAAAAPARAIPAVPEPSFPWGWLLAGGAVVAGLGLYFARRNPPAGAVAQPAYANASAYGGAGTLAGPQGFGTGGGVPAPGYGPGYAQPAGSGMGGKLMGGLATGLAVGAGVMAAQAIGKSLMGGNDHATAPGLAPGGGYVPFDAPANPDMGGQDFGLRDPASWDDGGGSSSDGGDWDS